MTRVIVYREDWLIYADVYKWDIDYRLKNIKVDVISIQYIPE